MPLKTGSEAERRVGVLPLSRTGSGGPDDDPYVHLQPATPGTPDVGSFNVDNTGIVNILGVHGLPDGDSVATIIGGAGTGRVLSVYSAVGDTGTPIIVVDGNLGTDNSGINVNVIGAGFGISSVAAGTGDAILGTNNGANANTVAGIRGVGTNGASGVVGSASDPANDGLGIGVWGLSSGGISGFFQAPPTAGANVSPTLVARHASDGMQASNLFEAQDPGGSAQLSITTDGSIQTFGLHINFSNLQGFANNAAALAGGLVAGDLYKLLAGDPRAVAIVF